MKCGLLAFSAVASLVSAAAITRRDASPPPTISGDAPYDVPTQNLTAAISCVGGLSNVKNPYLLVPGTGGNDEEDWDTTYLLLLGKNTSVPGGGLGYDVCYVSPPPYMLADIQVNAEYIAFAIDTIANHSIANGGPSNFPMMAWSQGNLAISWSLTFFPSTRKSISHYISFAGDFGGVSYENVANTNETTRKRQVAMNAPSVTQQLNPSNFLTAALAKGNKYAWVPTTSLYSTTDDVIQPEGISFNDTSATSYLGGEAGNLLAQGFCSNGIVGTVEHETWQYSNMGYQIVKLALASPRGFVTQAEAIAAVKAGIIPCDTLPAPGLGAPAVAAIQQALVLATAREHDPMYTSPTEPPLKAYVATFPDNEVHSY
ncbi:hypothetical protein P7C70_g4104, partial [Phenoliferia sp. Uapishka_3]